MKGPRVHGSEAASISQAPPAPQPRSAPVLASATRSPGFTDLSAQTTRATRPRSRSRTAARVIAFLGLPLVAAAAALLLIDKQYTATLDVKLPAASTATGAPNPQASLLGFAWSFARDNSTPQRPITCDVDRSDDPHAAQVLLHAPSQPACAALATSFAAGLQQRWHADVQAAETRWATEQEATRQRLARLRETLTAVEQEATAAGVDVGGGTPLDALATSCMKTQAQWGRYLKLRDRLADTRARRDALAEAPPVKNAVVDAATRESAYAAHVALQEDMRHLEIQLFQMRASMLAIGEAARDSLNRLLDATGDIAQLTESQAAVSTSPTARPLLEQTSEKAEEYHHQATLFAQDWTREYLGLQDLAPNPQTAEILQIYDRLVRRVRDFQQNSADTMTTLRRRVRTLSEQATDSPAGHTTDAKLTSRFYDLQNALQEFEKSAQDLYARDNYLLSAALESARGLWYRTEAMRRDVDGTLEERALRRAVAERNERIAALSDELDRLRGELLAVVDEIKVENTRTAEVAQGLPTYVAAASSAQSAQLRASMLRDQIAEVEAELHEGGAARLSDAARVPPTVTATRLAGLPANLPELAGGATLAGCLTLLAALGVFRLARL